MDNISLLHRAVRNRNIVKLQELLEENKILVNSRDQYNRTSLHIASLKGEIIHGCEESTLVSNAYLDILNILIEYGADIEAKDEFGRTPLYGAVILGHWDVVQLLLSNGANPNVQDNEGNTPMHVIFEEPLLIEGHEKMVRILFSMGGDPHIKNKKGYIPQDISQAIQNDNISKLLNSF